MSERTFNVAIAALGGEGGGVLVGWLLEAARHAGWFAQSTSVPGVAQRTGATIYYIEMFPREGHAKAPVMSLFPIPGDVDLVIASELVEAGRMASRGLITPERTRVIASSHRIYSVQEKSVAGDGRRDADAIREIVRSRSRDFLCLDLRHIAENHATPISAALLGALAGSHALPFDSTALEDVIRDPGGRQSRNLEAFSVAMRETEELAGSSSRAKTEAIDKSDDLSTWNLPKPTTPGGEQLLERLEAEFPEATHEMLFNGIGRLVDYQDFRYAHEYLDRLQPLLTKDNAAESYALVNETGRYLALWMAYEDIVRVAQLKTRTLRMNDIRSEVQASPGQPVRVTEYFAPRLEEFCALLPTWLAVRILKSSRWQALFGYLTKGMLVRTDALAPFLLLRVLANLRRWRRSTWGFSQESQRLMAWFDRILAADGYALSLELAKCGRLVKGYGETRRRGFSNLDEIFDCASSAEQVRLMREQALANA